MIDVKQPVRTAFFLALNGHLSYNSENVPVSDDMIPSAYAKQKVYVLLSSQTSNPKNTFSGWASEETIDLDIIYKASAYGAKEPLDQVAGQIMAILNPSITVNGLSAQPGVQFLNVIVKADRYLPLSLNQSNTLERRILTYSVYVSQL